MGILGCLFYLVHVMGWTRERLVVGGILVAVFGLWVLPILVATHTRPIPTFYSELAALLLANCVLTSAILLHWRRQRHFGVPSSGLAPVGFALVLFAQLAWVQDGYAMQWFLAIFFCLAAFLSMQAGFLVSSHRDLRRAIFCATGCGALLVGLLSSAFASIQALGLEQHFSPFVVSLPPSSGRRLFANLYQPNHLATVLSLASASAVYLAASRRLGKLLTMACLAILSIGLVLTGSRTPWVQQFVVSITVIVFAYCDKRSDERPFRWQDIVLACAPLATLAMATLLVGCLNDLLSLELGASALSRFGDKSQMSGRLALWHYAIEIFRKSPLVGVGWGEYGWIQYLLASQYGPVEIANNAHNIVLDVLAKTGLIGFFVLFTPLSKWMGRNARLIVRNEEATNRVYCFAMFAVLGVHAMLEFPQIYAYFLLPIFFLIGLTETKPIKAVSSSLVVSMLLVCTMGMYLLIVIAFFDYKKAEIAFEGKGSPSYSLINPPLIYGDWTRYGLISVMPLNTDLVASKIGLHEDAFRLDVSPLMIRRYIILLALGGRLDEALLQVPRLRNLSLQTFPEEFRKLVKMCDQDVPSLFALRRILLEQYSDQ